MFLQKCKSLHFPTKSVEMPSTDALHYLMYKTTRGALVNLKDNLDETLQKEFSKISEKGMFTSLLIAKNTNKEKNKNKIYKETSTPFKICIFSHFTERKQ